MPNLPNVAAPGGFVPAYAMALTGALGEAIAVEAAHPVPVTSTVLAASATAVTGTIAASATSAAFTPDLARPIILTLSGSWTGTVQLLRSVDGGTTKLPLTIGGQGWASFTANATEPVWTETEAGATFYLGFTRSTGTLTYRIAQ